jgi:hypothetical protein
MMSLSSRLAAASTVRASAVNASNVSRSDGYSEQDAQVICEFQAMVEREGGSYAALRTVLFEARQGRIPVQMDALRNAFRQIAKPS